MPVCLELEEEFDWQKMQRKTKKGFDEPIFLAYERDCEHYEGEKLEAYSKLIEAKILFQLVPIEGMGQPILFDEHAKGWYGLERIKDYIRSHQTKRT